MLCFCMSRYFTSLGRARTGPGMRQGCIIVKLLPTESKRSARTKQEAERRRIGRAVDRPGAPVGPEDAPVDNLVAAVDAADIVLL